MKAEFDDTDADAKAEEMSTGYWKLSSFSVASLQKYCNHLAPVVMSMPNLKQMAQRGQRQASKQTLLEVLEFGTGLGHDFTPRHELRNTDQFLKFLEQRHALRGYRLRDLSLLPPSWSEGDGVYGFEICNEKVIVWQKKFLIKRHLAAKVQKTIISLDALRIQSNFSETSATLVEDDAKGLCYSLVCSFPDHLVSSNLPKTNCSTGGTPGDGCGKDGEKGANEKPGEASQRHQG